MFFANILNTKNFFYKILCIVNHLKMSISSSCDTIHLEPEVFYSTSSCTGVTLYWQICARKKIFCKFRDGLQAQQKTHIG